MSPRLPHRALASIAFATAAALGALCLSGCSTVSELNPYVQISAYDTVVVRDFRGFDQAVGHQFADQVARKLLDTGNFARALSEPDGPGLLVTGTIEAFDSGGSSLRMSFDGGSGGPRFRASVQFYDVVSGDYIGSLEVGHALSEHSVHPGSTLVLTLMERSAERVAKWLSQAIEDERKSGRYR